MGIKIKICLFLNLVLFINFCCFNWCPVSSFTPLTLRNSKRYSQNRSKDLQFLNNLQGESLISAKSNSVSLSLLGRFNPRRKLFATGIDQSEVQCGDKLRNIVLYSGSDLRIHDHKG